MGLLDSLAEAFSGNTESSRRTLGLLAAAGPTTDPNQAGFGARMLRAANSVDDWKKQQMEMERAKQMQEFQQMQMANYASEIKQREAAAQKAAFLQDFIQKKLGGDGTSGAGMTQAPSDVGMGGAGGLTFAGVSAARGGGASPIPANANPGGLGNMSLDDVTVLKTLGGPDLLNNWKIAREGFERKPGTFYEGVNGKREYVADPAKGYNADGTLNENFVASQRTLASIPEEVKAKFNIVDVPMGDGTTRKMSVSDFVKQTSTPQSAPQPMPKTSGYAGGSVASATSGQREVLEQELRNPNLSPADKDAINRELSRLPKLGQTQSPLEAGRVKNITEAGGKVNDTWLKTSYEPVIKAGSTAQGVIDSVMVSRDALKAIGGGGWGTETKATLAGVLVGLGVAPNNAKMFAANAEVFQKTAYDRLLATLAEQAGTQTEGDADRASKTYASLKNTPQANEFILDMAQATAERQKAKSAFFRNALPIAQGKGDLMEVEREWDKRSPSIFDMPSMQRWGK